MANRTRLLTAAAFSLACWVAVPSAQAQNTVAVVSMQNAVVSSKEGQVAVKELTSKYTPIQKDLEGKSATLAQLQSQLTDKTLTPEKRVDLQRQIDEGGRAFTRQRDDTREQYQADQQRLLVPIEQRLAAVISKYAQQKGYTLVLDTTGPIVFASPTVDITKDVVTAFDNTPATMPTAVPPAMQQKQQPPKPVTQKQ